jgi:hypothetical protein
MKLLFSCFCFAIILLAGCGDNAIVTVYDKDIKDKNITCMRLSILSLDPSLEDALHQLYRFQNDCNLTLEVSTKSGIHCNSSHNAAAQATGNFPTSYLKMELRKGLRLQYNYYIDLKDTPDNSDIKKGFGRMKKDLNIIQ